MSHSPRLHLLTYILPPILLAAILNIPKFFETGTNLFTKNQLYLPKNVFAKVSIHFQGNNNKCVGGYVVSGQFLLSISPSLSLSRFLCVNMCGPPEFAVKNVTSGDNISAEVLDFVLTPLRRDSDYVYYYTFLSKEIYNNIFITIIYFIYLKGIAERSSAIQKLLTHLVKNAILSLHPSVHLYQRYSLHLPDGAEHGDLLQPAPGDQAVPGRPARPARQTAAARPQLPS